MISNPLTVNAVQAIVDSALVEDIGSGDATTLSVVNADQEVEALFVSRQAMVFSGEAIINAVYHKLSSAVHVDCHVKDGETIEAGTLIATVSGNAQAIIIGERVALNFIQRMSGIATLTKSYVDALGKTQTKLLDTRKTTPGIRLLEKYAVRCGGGQNHRIGLFDMVMIKDNHRMLADMQGPDGIQRAVEACRQKYPKLDVEVEVDTLEQLDQALLAGADYILLDNMSNEMMQAAVECRNQNQYHSKLEASGAITVERLPSLAKIGLDYISVGALTHSAKSVDIGLDIDYQAPSIFD